jgi:S-formylglutathione hydrolase
MALETVETHRSFGGTQLVFRHRSEATGTDMAFSLYLPPQAETAPVPLITYLSGLTCTWENVTTKGGFQGPASELGLAVLCPDTSPRGLGLPGEDEAYDFGSGAGFYVDATVEPWSRHYRMYSYVTRELPKLIAGDFPIDMARQGVFGHSMGGHGALTIALKNPRTYRSVSAFAPICAPMRVPWGQKALTGYLGSDRTSWLAYDSCALLADGHRVPDLLVDQGLADNFFERELRPELLEQACADAKVPLTLRRHAGYDHSYYFIASFMPDHLAWHAERLRR